MARNEPMNIETTPSIDPLAETRRLMAESAAAREEANALTDRSLDRLDAALVAMPDGTRLQYWSGAGDVVVRRDGRWRLPDCREVDEWVEGQWSKRALVIVEDATGAEETP